MGNWCVLKQLQYLSFNLRNKLCPLTTSVLTWETSYVLERFKNKTKKNHEKKTKGRRSWAKPLSDGKCTEQWGGEDTLIKGKQFKAESTEWTGSSLPWLDISITGELLTKSSPASIPKDFNSIVLGWEEDNNITVNFTGASNGQSWLGAIYSNYSSLSIQLRGRFLGYQSKQRRQEGKQWGKDKKNCVEFKGKDIRDSPEHKAQMGKLDLKDNRRKGGFQRWSDTSFSVHRTPFHPCSHLMLSTTIWSRQAGKT